MIKIDKKTRTLIIIMIVLVIFSVVISQWYYKDLNASVDPRIIPARELYDLYNTYTQKNDFDSIFFLMDTIENIYKRFDHYKDAFEIGVLYNNRAASWLTIALFSEIRDSTERDSLVHLAEGAARKSIIYYNNWKKKYEGMDEQQIYDGVSPSFEKGLESFSTEMQQKYIENRVEEILDSQLEIQRRLSVSYTNLGIVYRHRIQYDSAALCYDKALYLWNRNFTAENNLNLLLGRPQKKRNMIQRMFPPDRL
jgi:tetratricopeptide (TPR) repeat protein